MSRFSNAVGLPDAKHTACAALEELTAGNRRFLKGQQQGCINDAPRREELRAGQAPKAVVLTCADSRCPPELIFDQGFGDLFVIRVAGNIVSDHVMGSISYALQNLGTRLVVVLGHTRCGAVKAAVAELVERARQRTQLQGIGGSQVSADGASSEGGSSRRSSLDLHPNPRGSFELQREGSSSFDMQRQASNELPKWNSGELPAPAKPDRPLAEALAPLTEGGVGNAGGMLGIKGLVQKMWGLLGGQEATETLVRTASFRDLEHLDNPVNTIVVAILPAVKQVVWEVLHDDGAASLTSPIGLSPPAGAASPPARLGGGPSWAERAATPSVADAAHAVVVAHEAAVAAEAAAATAAAAAAAAQEEEGGGAERSGHPDPGALHQSPSLTGLVEKMKQPLLVRPSVDREELYRKLGESQRQQHICLDTHILNCNNLLKEAAYQNVRRQCSTVWEAMERFIEGPAAAELLMVQAMYDLDTGSVDFFGLHG